MVVVLFALTQPLGSFSLEAPTMRQEKGAKFAPFIKALIAEPLDVTA